MAIDLTRYSRQPQPQGMPPVPPPLNRTTPTGSGKHEYLYRGSFTMLRMNLDYGERIKAESDAMVAMSDTVDVDGKLEGGILGGIGRMLAGEKFFFQELVARRGPGEVYLSPAALGDLHEIDLDGSVTYTVQKDGFFAATDGVTITTKLQNLTRGLFSGEGFFVLKAGGRGKLFVSSFGAIHALDIPPGKEMVIDNGHLVAWPETMQFTIERAAAGWLSSFTSGEGLVCRFRGPGRVLIQSRNTKGLAAWLMQFMPKRG